MSNLTRLGHDKDIDIMVASIMVIAVVLMQVVLVSRDLIYRRSLLKLNRVVLKLNDVKQHLVFLPLVIRNLISDQMAHFFMVYQRFEVALPFRIILSIGLISYAIFIHPSFPSLLSNSFILSFCLLFLASILRVRFSNSFYLLLLC